MRSRAILFLLIALVLSGCVGTGGSILGGGEPQAASQELTGATSGTASITAYALGAGDKLRIIVFGEAALSGEFVVDDGGTVALPLVGKVAAAGKTVSQFEDAVGNALKNGYLKNPKVSAEILNYRPFFILGEVKNGGSFPFKVGLTVQDAVAVAGGFSYRANTKVAVIRREGKSAEARFDLTRPVPVYPGDNITIPERLF